MLACYFQFEIRQKIVNLKEPLKAAVFVMVDFINEYTEVFDSAKAASWSQKTRQVALMHAH